MAQATNLINNWDFSGGMTGWTIKDGNTAYTVWDTSSGYAKATAQNGAAYWVQPNGPTGAQALSCLRQQNIMVPAGSTATTYRLEWDYNTVGSGWTAGTPSGWANDFSQVELQLITYDATGANINNGPNYSSLLKINTASNGWTHWSQDVTIVPGTSKFYLKFMMGFSATNGNAMDQDPDNWKTPWARDSFSVDNVSLSALTVPEPGSLLALLSGFAGMGMMIVRRKRA